MIYRFGIFRNNVAMGMPWVSQWRGKNVSEDNWHRVAAKGDVAPEEPIRVQSAKKILRFTM